MNDHDKPFDIPTAMPADVTYSYDPTPEPREPMPRLKEGATPGWLFWNGTKQPVVALTDSDGNGFLEPVGDWQDAREE